MSRFVWRIVLLGLTLIGCYLPWVWHPSAALTSNAYDLAEWLSLYPAVRGSTPPLWEPFMLRGLWAILAALVALEASVATEANAAVASWLSWLLIGLSVALCLTLLPPLDFFRGGWDDPNYRQQFALAVIAAITVSALLRFGKRWQRPLRIALALMGVLMGTISLIRALEHIQREAIYPVSVTVGGGFIMLISSLLLIGAAALFRSDLLSMRK